MSSSYGRYRVGASQWILSQSALRFEASNSIQAGRNAGVTFRGLYLLSRQSETWRPLEDAGS
jgi:hypothetical protein